MPSVKNPQPPGFGVHKQQDFGDLVRREPSPVERDCTFCGAKAGDLHCYGAETRVALPYFHAARRHPGR